MKAVAAYLDESGDTNLVTSTAGVPRYYVVCAILVNQSDSQHLMERLEILRRRHFQTGEMKSNGIKDKDGHSRRIRILRDILEENFQFYALAVDKEKIIRDSGLQYKAVFIKYVNGLICSKLFVSFPELTIVADEQGRKEFQDSLQEYIKKRHKPDLFWQSDFQTVSSDGNVIVQLADFIVGTIAKVYEKKSNVALREAYLELVQRKALGFIEWPTKHRFSFPPDVTTPDYNQFIHEHALDQAESFLSRNEDAGDEDTRIQVCVLNFLVFHSRLSQDVDYISTSKILDHLMQLGIQVSEHAIRSTVIAVLRDKGVIIASCNRGYKIPRSYADLLDFVNRVSGQVVPLLQRLQMARASYLLASQGEVDLLKGPNYPHLDAFLKHIESTSVPENDSLAITSRH